MLVVSVEGVLHDVWRRLFSLQDMQVEGRAVCGGAGGLCDGCRSLSVQEVRIEGPAVCEVKMGVAVMIIVCLGGGG